MSSMVLFLQQLFGKSSVVLEISMELIEWGYQWGFYSRHGGEVLGVFGQSVSANRKETLSAFSIRLH